MKILLVEDDTRLADLLIGALGSQHHSVEWTQTGQAGIDFTHITPFDLIILDVRLPDIDGLVVCQQLRQQGYSQPILLLTAQDSLQSKVYGLDAGADDYLVKPFELDELLARIRALTRRHSDTRNPILQWGELQLDPESCDVTYQGHSIDLTPKEYSILELLLRNEQKVFSLQAILEQLWSLEESPTEKTVRVHIRGLRQKLKAAGVATHIIETVYGLGYRSGPPPLQAEPASTQLLTYTEALTQAWERHKPETLKQVRQLESLIQTWCRRSLSFEEHTFAQQDAHQLSGLLGICGYQQGSVYARRILDCIQHQDPTVPLLDSRRLREWLHHLNQAVQGDPSLSLQPHILCATQDLSLQHDLKHYLAEVALESSLCQDVEGCLQVIDQASPNLVILDTEFMQIKESRFWQSVYEQWYLHQVAILLILNQTELQAMQSWLQTGATDFILKPIIKAELISRIWRSLRVNS